MRRLGVLWLALLPACLTLEETDETTLAQRSGIAPWHMWGNSQTVVAPSNGTGTSAEVPTTGQLLRISYKRPDTWHWLFASKLLAAPNATDVGDHANVQVYFDLTVGIGRSQITLPGFELHEFVWDGPNRNAPLGRTLWSTAVYGPNRTFVVAPGAAQNVRDNWIDQITAEDIQLSCRVFFSTPGGLTGTATVEVQAHFAPATHIRPEWHNGQFPGAEDGAGTSVSSQVQQLSRSRR